MLDGRDDLGDLRLGVLVHTRGPDPVDVPSPRFEVFLTVVVPLPGVLRERVDVAVAFDTEDEPVVLLDRQVDGVSADTDVLLDGVSPPGTSIRTRSAARPLS